MVASGEGIDEGDAEGGFAVEGCLDEVELAGVGEAGAGFTDDVGTDFGGSVAQLRGMILKGDDIALRFVEGSEIVGFLEELVELAAEVEGDVDKIAEELRAEEGPGAPESEGDGAFGAFEGAQAAVVFGEAGGGGIEEIRGFLTEGFVAVGTVFVEQERTESGDEHHFVGVPDESVGTSQARDEMFVLWAEQSSGAVGGIDVHPDAEFGTDRGDVVERIEGADGSRAGAGDDGDDRGSLGAKVLKELTEFFGIHAAAGIKGSFDDLMSAESEDAGGACDGIVGIGLTDEDRFGVLGQTVFPGAGKGDVACGEESGEIRDRSAVGHDGGGTIGSPAEVGGEFVSHCPFDGGDPGAHFIDGVDLIGDGADGIKVTRQRDGSGDLVADVTGGVEIVATAESELEEFAKAGGDLFW